MTTGPYGVPASPVPPSFPVPSATIAVTVTRVLPFPERHRAGTIGCVAFATGFFNQDFALKVPPWLFVACSSFLSTAE